MSTNRILGLDIARAVAILMVVFSHSTNLLSPFILPEHSIGWKILGATQSFGPLGVELFFVLSGYLIGGIIIIEFQGQYGMASIINFWIKRWFRTLPNYYFILFINFFLFSYLFGNKFDWHFLLFLQNFSHPALKFFGESWSLAVEEWFYLIVPLWLLGFSYIFRSSSKKKILLYSIITYILVFGIIRAIYASRTYDLETDSSIRRVVFLRLDAIMFGVLIVYFNEFYKNLLHKIKGKLALIGLIGLTIVTIFNFEGVNPWFKYYVQNRLYKYFANAFLYTAIPIFFSFFLPYVAGIKEISNRILEKSLRHISRISYSIYLIHFSLIGHMLFRSVPNNYISSIFIYTLYWFVVIGASSLLYYLFEMPMTLMRERFVLHVNFWNTVKNKLKIKLYETLIPKTN